MNVLRICLAGLLPAAIIAGTVSDRPLANSPLMLGGYHVLEGDFHVHSFPFSWGTLSPWDTVIEAGYQGLDVVALTPHNHVWVAKLGRSFSQLVGGPLILVGEEIASRRYHLLAVGITDAISERQPAAQAIREVHRQGGVAIAAHPYPIFWPAYDVEALRLLDGSEVVRPDSQVDETAAAELRQFFEKGSFTAIGSSDYHGMGVPGHSRTFVFTPDPSEAGILDALRVGRTVVFDRGRVYGDPVMIELAAQHGTLDRGVPDLPAPGAARFFSRLAAVLGLVGLLLFNRW